MLAMFLPQIINMLTKDGSTPAGGLDEAAKSAMPDLGGLLGGLLGGALGGGGRPVAPRPGPGPAGDRSRRPPEGAGREPAQLTRGSREG